MRVILVVLLVGGLLYGCSGGAPSTPPSEETAVPPSPPPAPAPPEPSPTATAESLTPAKPPVHVIKMVTVNEKNFFDPPELTIKVGDTVRWVNESGVHDVSAIKVPEGVTPFKSELFTAPGMTFEYTFTVPGEYGYVCTPHEVLGMVGKIIVMP